MLFEVLLLIAALWWGTPLVALWRDESGVFRVLGALLLAVILGLLTAPWLAAVERIRIEAVNTNRSEDLSFTVGTSLGVERKAQSGLLEPYELAGTRIRDGRLEVFKNQNSLVWWKFNRQALQMELTVGKVYDVKVYGWFGLRNIVDIVHTVHVERDVAENGAPIAPADAGGAPHHDGSVDARKRAAERHVR